MQFAAIRVASHICAKPYAFLLAMALFLTPVRAGQEMALLTLTPDQGMSSPLTLPILKYDNGLSVAAGAIGDGVLMVEPGLAAKYDTSQFPITAPGYDQSPSGSWRVWDLTLRLDGLTAAAPTMVVPLGPGTTLLAQALNPGNFELTCTGGQVTLLKGTIGESNFAGMAGKTTGFMSTSSVTYQSGILYDAIVAASYSPHGEISWNFFFDTPLAITDGPNPRLEPFTVTGGSSWVQFTVAVPEPASLSLLTVALVALARRQRRR